MVRTRFAPSPTGFLHIGGLRTALFSYALAKRHKGKFILRIEDTDKKREVKGGVKKIIDCLRVFGLNFDEGPEVGGPYGPYIQSERLGIYQNKAKELIQKGKAYYCFCSKERIMKLREEMKKEKKQPMYDRKCRDINLSEAKKRISKGEKYVIRLKVPQNRKIEINDVLLGKVSWNSNVVDDQVIIKDDGFPTYHLAVVVDDVLMKITHITRGIEWLPSVPKHVILFEAFNYNLPVMAHLPVILDPAGGKLSKRKGNVSCEQHLMEGYLPEAILNFIMLLGWSPKDDREIFSLKEFVSKFSLSGMNKSSPVFNRQKLLWFNGKYIRKLSSKMLTNKFTNWAKLYMADNDLLRKMLHDKDIEEKVKLIRERVSLLSEIPLQLEFFYKYITPSDPSTVKGVKDYDRLNYKKVIKDYIKIINKYDNDSSKWNKERWVGDIRALAEEWRWKAADLFMIIRLAVCGNPISPPLYESMVVLGKKEVICRLENFVTTIK